MVFQIGTDIYAGMGAKWGGAQGVANYSDFYRYDPGTNTWTAMAAFPGTAGRQFSWFALGGNGYVIGFDSSVYQYTPGTNTWTQLPCDFPGTTTNWSGFSGMVLGSRAFIVNTATGENWEFTP